MDLTCEDFGLTPDQMLDRLIDKMAQKQLGTIADKEFEEGEEPSYANRETISARLDRIITERIDEQVALIAERDVLPRVDELIAGLTFQKTNTWGEAAGEKKTIREHVTDLATNYLTEEVDYDGRNRKECQRRGYTYHGAQSRLVHAINKHIQYNLDTALTKAIKDVHKTFADGVTDMVQDLLGKMTVSFQASVKTKS